MTIHCEFWFLVKVLLYFDYILGIKLKTENVKAIVLNLQIKMPKVSDYLYEK